MITTRMTDDTGDNDNGNYTRDNDNVVSHYEFENVFLALFDDENVLCCANKRYDRVVGDLDIIEFDDNTWNISMIT